MNCSLVRSVLESNSSGLLLLWLEQLWNQDPQRGCERVHGVACRWKRWMHCYAQRSKRGQLPAYGLYVLDFSECLQRKFLAAQLSCMIFANGAFDR